MSKLVKGGSAKLLLAKTGVYMGTFILMMVVLEVVLRLTKEPSWEYSNSFDQAQSLALIKKTVMKCESDGVMMTYAQKNQYLANDDLSFASLMQSGRTLRFKKHK
jgi:2-polyprenyl-3-methyl-5-hydroxy-6-metoxy-1,4-benzoquinol methylase